MNKVTFEFTPEDRLRLDRLADLLEAAIPSMKRVAADLLAAAGCTPTPEPPIDPDDNSAPVAAPAADPAAPVVPAPAPAAKPVSLPELQKALTVRCAESPEMREKVKALVHEYAPAVSGVPEDKRAEVLARLAEI